MICEFSALLAEGRANISALLEVHLSCNRLTSTTLLFVLMEEGRCWWLINASLRDPECTVSHNFLSWRIKFRGLCNVSVPTYLQVRRVTGIILYVHSRNVISLSLFLASVFVRRQCFQHLSLIKFFKLFKTLHVSVSICHPQVLKLFVKSVCDF
jgi:hypothetical protein